ncbi:hypothetical protein [Cedecea lapagei]|uniref:hypothetical protein n=1 Tax=Cedecea lapagei TaxID=158823 RepID=UPI001BD0EDD3|nr:hypothetical protein [Cedecea lapagei]
MKIIQTVKKTMGELFTDVTKKLTISRTSDVFSEVGFNYSFDNITYGTRRQVGEFYIDYIYSPNPKTTVGAAPKPSIKYDDVMTHVSASLPTVCKNNNLVLLGYTFGQSEIITDSTTGSVTVAFTINIKVTEKIR